MVIKENIHWFFHREKKKRIPYMEWKWMSLAPTAPRLQLGQASQHPNTEHEQPPSLTLPKGAEPTLSRNLWTRRRISCPRLKRSAARVLVGQLPPWSTFTTNNNVKKQGWQHQKQQRQQPIRALTKLPGPLPQQLLAKSSACEQGGSRSSTLAVVLQ